MKSSKLCCAYIPQTQIAGKKTMLLCFSSSPSHPRIACRLSTVHSPSHRLFERHKCLICNPVRVISTPTQTRLCDGRDYFTCCWTINASSYSQDHPYRRQRMRSVFECPSPCKHTAECLTTVKARRRYATDTYEVPAASRKPTSQP